MLLASIACVASLAGCVTSPVAHGPNNVNVVAAGAAPPLPPPPPVVEVYQPMPFDVTISAVLDRDVVFVHGDTFIWFVGPDGRRHRQFYAHGDHRADVFHRRDELRTVMAHHGGHLPDHPIGGHGPVTRVGGPLAAPQKHAMPGHPRVAHAPSAARPAHPAFAAKPARAEAAAKPADKDRNKS